MPLRAMSRTPQTGLWLAEILLAESCHEQVSFESGFKQRKGRSISEIGWQRVPDRRCKKAEGTLLERFGVAFGTLRSFSHDERSFVLVHMHIGSEKDKLVESRQKSGRQEWLSCTVIGI